VAPATGACKRGGVQTRTIPPEDPDGRAAVGVFGGSGLYSFLDDAVQVDVTTPWGPPAALPTVGTIEGVRVAFLPRHGPHHEWPAHRVNYRANVDALRVLGVHSILAPFSAGSLQPTIHPGDFVVVDQFVDRTKGRDETYHDHFGDGPRHVSTAEPYDAALRELLVGRALAQGRTVHDHGTVVVVNGPRFSTRAESAWFSSMGWHLVNMTQYPECVLAREVELRYAGVGLVTDYDAGIAVGVDPVTQEEVFLRFRENLDRVRDLLHAVIPSAAELGPSSSGAAPVA